MENTPQPNYDLKSTTIVTISMLNAAESSSESPNQNSQAVVSATTSKQQLVKERDSNANQIKHLKAAAENYKFLLAEKEKTISDLGIGIHLLKQSFRPLDDKIQVAKQSIREKRTGELKMLLQKIKSSVEWEQKFNEAIADYNQKIARKNTGLLVQRKKMSDECDVLQRRYHNEVENTKASLKELNKVYKQALADHAKISEERKFQLEKTDLLKQEFNLMHDQLEKIAVERRQLTKQSKELDARWLQLDELIKQERESPALLKTEDNKRNLKLRAKQIADATTLRIQKQQSLVEQKTKLKSLAQERDSLADERKSLEKLFAEKMLELEMTAAEITRTQTELENTKKRTEEMEQEMRQKLDELRRKSESYGAELIREMEGVRRDSVFFADQMERKKHAEKKQRERTKEELRQELQSLDQMMEVLQQGHQLEMDTKQRHFARVERDLEVFGEGEKEGNEYEIKLIKSNIEKLGVKRNAAQVEFEERQAKLKEDIEWLRRKMDHVKKAAQASQAIEDNNRRVEVTRDLVRNMERQINAKKAKYMQMHKEAYDLKNDMEQKGLESEFDPEAMMISQPIDISDSPVVQSPDAQVKF